MNDTTLKAACVATAFVAVFLVVMLHAKSTRQPVFEVTDWNSAMGHTGSLHR